MRLSSLIHVYKHFGRTQLCDQEIFLTLVFAREHLETYAELYYTRMYTCRELYGEQKPEIPRFEMCLRKKLWEF